MTVISGYVSGIIYRNRQNGYCVLSVATGRPEQPEITLVGTMPLVEEGEPIEAEGEFVEHPVYGEQLAVTSFRQTAPRDAAAMERYLGSGTIRGIGPALAARIVGRFGADTLRIMEEEPLRLAEVRGISANGARQIAVQFSEKREQRQAMLFLTQYGISLALAVKIYDAYGPEIYSVIQKNPYRLAEDIPGVGFAAADGIASRAGIAVDSDFRIRCGIVHVLNGAAQEGHVCLPEDELAGRAQELLSVGEAEIRLQIGNLLADRRIMQREDGGTSWLYSAPFYYMELGSASLLARLDQSFVRDTASWDRQIRRAEKEERMTLDGLQREAVQACVRRGVTVITGGPGTGKTTTIRTIIRLFEGQGMTVELAAPTGRAAKRMAEASGHDARTIHRLLEFSGQPQEDGDEDSVRFARNEDNPLEADVVVIDEASMVDIRLLFALLKAIVPGTRLILVGDAHQLPSVGPGNVLRDILASGCFSVIELTHIFRQAEESDIVMNAHRIHAGAVIDPEKKSRDFLFIRRQDVRSVLGAVIGLVRDRLPSYVGAQTADIQVLTPMRKGPLGVAQLNTVLQDYLNPPREGRAEHVFPQGIFRVGDKVMQIRNNYDAEWETRGKNGIVTGRGQGVFNGDMGVIRSINTWTEELDVEFDEGRIITYTYAQTEQLELAYAVTVHKAQGSEYPAVVIPLLSGPPMLMNRNLIYTAVTRARRCVCVVGLPETFQVMVDNDAEAERYSGLDSFLKEIYQWREH